MIGQILGQLVELFAVLLFGSFFIICILPFKLLIRFSEWLLNLTPVQWWLKAFYVRAFFALIPIIFFVELLFGWLP